MVDDDTQDTERRSSTRLKAQAYVSLEVVGVHANDQGFGVVLDVSTTGIQVRTPQPPTVGQQVILRVGIGEELFKVLAFVARLTPREEGTFDVGLAYSALDQLKIQFLEAFLAEHPIATS